MMKYMARLFLFSIIFAVYPVLAQEETETATIFLVNHTSFHVDVYLDGADTPTVTNLAAFNRFVHFADADKINVTMHETERPSPIANSVTFQAQPGTINYVMLYRFEGELDLIAFDPETLVGEPIDYATQSPWLYVNLLTTASAVDVYYDDELVIEDLGYGEIAVAFAPLAPFVEEMRDAETGAVIDRYEDLYGAPYYMLLDIRETEDETYFIDIYDLVTTDLLTYLTELNALNIAGSRYTTFVALLKAADLTELVATADELNFIVPSDAAFDALPSGTLDALRDDPDQLHQVLLGHMFEFGQFAEVYEGPRKLVTLAGTTIVHEFDEETGTDRVNGVEWGDLLLMQNEGRLTNVISVDEVLLPE